MDTKNDLLACRWRDMERIESDAILHDLESMIPPRRQLSRVRRLDSNCDPPRVNRQPAHLDMFASGARPGSVNGSLHLTHTSPAPIPGLLVGMEKVLCNSCVILIQSQKLDIGNTFNPIRISGHGISLKQKEERTLS